MQKVSQMMNVENHIHSKTNALNMSVCLDFLRSSYWSFDESYFGLITKSYSQKITKSMTSNQNFSQIATMSCGRLAISSLSLITFAMIGYCGITSMSTKKFFTNLHVQKVMDIHFEAPTLIFLQAIHADKFTVTENKDQSLQMQVC